MPVKLGGHLHAENEARIEIIDIMFFLLAAFMSVSLSMVTMRSVKGDHQTRRATRSAQGEHGNVERSG